MVTPNTINEICLKCDVIDGSVVNWIRQPLLCSFVLKKPASYKLFSQPETLHHKKIKIFILNTITFYLEDHNHEEVDFNRETLTFTVQIMKI